MNLPWAGTFALTLTLFCWRSSGDDWPQWMGPKRDGVWREENILEVFPAGGPQILWRAPVNRGYCGPAVAGNRVYLVDRIPGPPLQRKPGDRTLPSVAGTERVVCLDAGNGTNVWEYSYDCPYRIAYPSGPRATPVVEGKHVYALGAMGNLLCLEAATGKLVWERQFLKDFLLSEPPLWGYASHPLIDGDKLVCLVGGDGSAVVAFNKDSGKELWRSLSAEEIGYAAPVLYEAGTNRQLIVWHPDAIAGLDPQTGKALWTQKYPIEGKPQRPEVTIAMPRINGDKLLVSSFYHGALMLNLGSEGSAASVVWNRHSSSKSTMNDGLHTVMCVPVWIDRHVYGICGFGELRCLDAATGDRVWESDAAMNGKLGNFANAFIVRHKGSVFLWNDQGELVLGKVSPEGFQLVSRAKLLDTIENTRGRDVLWCHPAFAHRNAYMHNGKELICVSLSKPS